MIDFKRVEELRWFLRNLALGSRVYDDETDDLLSILDSYAKTITPASPDSMSGHDEETKGLAGTPISEEARALMDDTAGGRATADLVASHGPSTPDERRAWDGEQPLLVRFDEATEWVVERAKTYRNDWIWQERLKAVEIARALLLAPATQPTPIAGRSGCEIVGCQYAHRNDDGIATCLAPGDYCIKREDCPAPQPSVTRVGTGGMDFWVAAIRRDDVVSVAFCKLPIPTLPGHVVPGMKKGMEVPDEQILFEVTINDPAHCMTPINAFCEAWKALTDRSLGIRVVEAEEGR